MAASDVRKEFVIDQESESDHSSIKDLTENDFSEDEISQISSIHSDAPEPSYLIVQKQMRDLILSQNFAVEELLKSNVSASLAS